MTLRAVKQRFGIIGNDPKLDQAISTAMRVANTDLTVLITGESGTGKEVFSKMIHSLSARKHNPFIAINCGAIPEGTINSELFGHDKGAFTGATGDRKGYFETVDKGTIFLDEVGEMPLDTQSYLLRVLESGEFIRVGSSVTQKTDVRVIAATNVNLLDKIRNGKFREDLYYRLNTVPIQVPPIRERGNDIDLLFRKFAMDFSDKYKMPPVRLDDQAAQLIKNYSWPGNVRQLRNFTEQVSILADTENRRMDASNLLEILPELSKRNLPSITKDKEQRASFEEREILYKLLFDMKNDLNDLKSLVFGLIKKNDLSFPEKSSNALPPPDMQQEYYDNHETEQEESWQKESPVIISKEQKGFDEMEVVEENLSIEEMEKDLIRKALKKHSNRRKEAAYELGISERTLYRKIKQYNL